MSASKRVCEFPDCGRDHKARGWCGAHYLMERQGRPMVPVAVVPNYDPICTFPGCDKRHRTQGLCGGHHAQRLRGQDLQPLRGPSPDGFIDAYGYRIIYAPEHSTAGKNGWTREHRKVMSDMLGRPLLPGENVHHKNGVRDDNRPENLELWVTLQPAGQRPEDLLEYADEIIRRYRVS